MGRSRRRTSRLPTTVVGLLSWAAVANAVSLSDFTPEVTNLTPSCEAAYITTIPGCKVSDFTNAAHTCSSACLNGLVQINALVNEDCSEDDVEETSIVGLFLIGQAIQLLCNVAVVTTTTGVTGTGGGGVIPTGGAASFSSTMTMFMTSPTTTAFPASLPLTSLFTSSTSTLSRPTMSASDGMIGYTPLVPPPSTTSIIATTMASLSTSALSTKKTTSSTTKEPQSETTLSPAAQESQRSGNVGSGGGSPFDNIDNSEAMAMRPNSLMFGGVLAAGLLVGMLNLG